MGRSLLIGKEPDKEVQEYVKYLRKCGSPINTAIVIATAKGIITSVDANLLACNGGGISLTKDWAKSLLHRMGMVKRRASAKAKVSVDEFEKLKAEFFLDIKNVVDMDEIPPALIINWDQTGMNYVPVGSWTMEVEGAKRLKSSGKMISDR